MASNAPNLDRTPLRLGSWFYYISVVAISFVVFRLTSLYSTVTDTGCLHETWLAYGSSGLGLVHLFQLTVGLLAGLGLGLLVLGLRSKRWLEGALIVATMGFCGVWYLSLNAFEALLMRELGLAVKSMGVLELFYPAIDSLGNASCS